METSQFEAVKVALKQDRTGYVLTLCIHPDEISEEIMRDFVGSRYQVVMVRLTGEERPMNREQELSKDMVRAAGILCRDEKFWQFLFEAGGIIDKSEEEATTWLKDYLKVKSRSEISESAIATEKMMGIKQEFQAWKASA
jgi:hypothetical protein